ncbi:MAG: ATP-binding protein [Mariprofundaceae bacterium]
MKPAVLRILIVEDDHADAELIELQVCKLSKDCECRRLASKAELEDALAGETWDLVICDHVLPDLDSFTVLSMLQHADPLLPLILVSGAIGEEEVANVMRAGARHFVNKNNLERLPQVASLCLMEAKSSLRDQHDEQVREQLSRLEAIKNLAGGVAHDFNNVLAAIGNAAYLIGAQAGENPRLKSSVNIIEKSVDRGAATARKLLEFARGGRFESNRIQLSELVEQALAHPDLDLPSSIQLQVHDAADQAVAGEILGDALQLKSLLIGIISNAVEAMGLGGRVDLYIDEWHVNHDDAEAYPGLHAGTFERCRVVDNGFGMDDTLLAHVFEPFFTTKFQGRGLGLAAAYGIMKGHDGFIYIDSEPGKGTTVTLLFPRHSEGE